MRVVRLLAALLTLALLLVACGEAPAEETAGGDSEAATASEGTEGGAAAQATDFSACQVTDTGGIDDRSFNQTAYKGLQDAETELGVDISVLESESDADFEPNINTFIEQGCDLIVTVGFLLGEATQAAAEANPDTPFAIVDFDFFDAEATEDVTIDNVRELTFATDQAAFLAGYLAAGMTETGTVGTYGGLNIPTVTIFMNGFLAGVRHHNAEKGTDVQVIGWDGSDGLFTGNFESQEDGRQLTEQLLQRDADIIMPVAGPVGLGTAAALEDAGEGSLIWVDTDGYESAPQFSSLMLTSVMKNMDVAVFDSIEAAVNDSFEGGKYVGTLENEGVAIAPYHDFDTEVPEELKSEIDELREGIIAGDISVSPDDYEG
ncbi:MAG TPA: BMP family ABC transporter substrate-binding protein [Euzebyales bacterium]|nr:BMP family ABC transporter substrate-binding protein [Euzebyales bacterium]